MKHFIISCLLFTALYSITAKANDSVIECQSYNSAREVEVRIIRSKHGLYKATVSKENKSGRKTVLAIIPTVHHGLCRSNDCFMNLRNSFRLVLNPSKRSGVFSFSSGLRSKQIDYLPMLCY